jgi:hypothetical protein
LRLVWSALARPASDDAILAGRRSRSPGLQESLEYPSATSDVLNVISRLGAELATMLQTLVETGVHCNTDRGAISPTEIERVLSRQRRAGPRTAR